MAYTVYNNDGSVLVNIPNGEIDEDTTSITLVGKNVNNYGEIINNNFVKILNSFADNTGPLSPQIGQLWYDTSSNKLKAYNGVTWEPTLQPEIGGSPPPSLTSSQGDLWFDSTNYQLYVFFAGEWELIGPAVSPNKGKFGVEDPPANYRIKNDINQNKDVGLIYSYGNPYQILSPETFTLNTASSQYYFSTSTPVTIYSGTTILNTLTVVKNLVVSGNITANGIELTPYKGFTAYYDRSWFGSGITDEYTATNNFIRLEILPYLFSTSSTVTNLLSEIKVLTAYNTQTESRHYRLEERVPSVRAWEAYERYNTTGTSYWSILGDTSTNVIVLGV